VSCVYFSARNCNFDTQLTPIQLCGAAWTLNSDTVRHTRSNMPESVKCHVIGLDSADNLSVAARGNFMVELGAWIITRLTI